MPETDEHRRQRFAKQRAGYDAARAVMRAKLLGVALPLAREHGYQWITRQMVATAAGVSLGSVNNCYGTMIELKRTVLRWAIEYQDAELIAQGLANGSPITADIDQGLRERAAEAIAAR